MRIKVFILQLFLLSGCAIPEYQKFQANGYHRVGWKEFKISEDTYNVVYQGKDNVNARKGFLRRSSELSRENNKKYFCVKNQSAGQESHAAGMLIGGAMLTLPQYSGVVVLKDKKYKKCYSEEVVWENTKP